MKKEFGPESVEILPESIGDMQAFDAVPLLKRAADRTEVLGWVGEFADGLRENLRGAAAWVKAVGPEVSKKTLAAVTTAAFVAASLSACAKGPSTSTQPVYTETAPRVTEVSPTQVPPTETATATQVPTSTETATATENPAENANPFDRSTFPAEFQKDPATMTEQEQTDYQTFLNAARENFFKNQGIQDKVDQMKASGAFNVDFSDLVGMLYAQNNPDQLKNPELVKGKDIVVGPAEIREALQWDDFNIIDLWTQTVKDKGKIETVDYGWTSASWLGTNKKNTIFGVDTKILYSDEVGTSGVLGGISSIDSNPDTKVLWIIVKDSGNKWYLAPRMVNFAPDFTLSGSEGATCRIGPEAFALYELPEGVPFGPLVDAHGGKPWTLDSFYSNLGRPAIIIGRSDPFEGWATGDNSKFSFNPCYVHGVPIEGEFGVNPYFSPPIWGELTSAK